MLGVRQHRADMRIAFGLGTMFVTTVVVMALLGNAGQPSFEVLRLEPPVL
jgi:hypothetical protein